MPGIAHTSCQIDTPVAFGATFAKNGSILAIHGHDTDITNGLVLIGGTLVGLHLVCDS